MAENLGRATLEYPVSAMVKVHVNFYVHGLHVHHNDF